MESPPTLGTVPVHHRIADSLRARIESGDLQPGDRLPTVEDLRQAWHCAAGSARSAIDVLKGEGLISGGRGRAATVRTPSRRIRISTDQNQIQKDLILKPKKDRSAMGALELTAGIPIAQAKPTYRYEIVEASHDLAFEFSIESGTDLVQRVYEVLDAESELLIAWSVSYIPKDLIQGNPALLDEKNEPWPGGHQHQLYTVGIEVDRFVRSVIAIEPSNGERQRWGVEPGVPMLRVRSRSIDIDNRIVEISDANYPADRTEIVFTEQLERWPANHARYNPAEGDE